MIQASMSEGYRPEWKLDMEAEPNPPVWPDDGSVMVVRPSVDDYDDYDSDFVQRKLEDFAQDDWDDNCQTFTSNLHFSSRRRVVLFAPGTYPCRFQVGYYTQVLGLGRSMDDVRFVAPCDGPSTSLSGPYVSALNKQMPNPHGTSLDTFWRGAENFTVEGDLQWAVSQASPLRKVRVAGDLILHDGAAYASGGHVANAIVHGCVRLGGQQQFLFRNVHIKGGCEAGAWSTVFVGCTGRVPPESPGNDGAPSVTVVETPRVRMEKPYICLQDDAVHYELRVPRATYDDSGTVGSAETTDRIIDFTYVRVARPGDPVERIQEALDQGKHVVLSPGIYALRAPIHIRTAGQVLLGLGLATIVAPSTGEPCIHVAPNVLGVVVAGVMLEASPRIVSEGASQVGGIGSLFEWGSPGICDPGVKDCPGGLMDVFCRVGGSLQSWERSDLALDVMMRIHSGRIVGDNLWLWRADHAELAPGERPNYPVISAKYWQVEEHECRVETGFLVLGDDVTIYGLAVEHANGHQTIWVGGTYPQSWRRPIIVSVLLHRLTFVRCCF
jgi:hypothetical protein